MYNITKRGEKMIRVSIIGATGYTGIELVRLLANHPEVELSSLVSRNASNKPLSDIYPQFIGRIDLKFSEYDCQAICQNSDIVFYCPTPWYFSGNCR